MVVVVGGSVVVGAVVVLVDVVVGGSVVVVGGSVVVVGGSDVVEVVGRGAVVGVVTNTTVASPCEGRDAVGGTAASAVGESAPPPPHAASSAAQSTPASVATAGRMGVWMVIGFSVVCDGIRLHQDE